jgi:hypothetical protein
MKNQNQVKEFLEMLQPEDIPQMQINISLGFIFRMKHHTHDESDFKKYLDQMFLLDRLREIKRT